MIATGEESARPSQIWLFDDAPIHGGAELFALRLARFAAGSGHEVRIVCPAGTELAAAAAGAGAEHVHAGFPPLGPLAAHRWAGGVLGIRRLLAAVAPGAIAVANTARAQAYVAAAAASMSPHPAIVHVLHEQATLGRLTGRFAFRRSGGIVAIGENVASACRSRLRGVPVHKANNFLDPPWFDQPRAPGSGEDAPVVGVLARLIPEKGVLELIEELSRCESWSRAVIGGGDQDPAYARLVRERASAPGLDGRVTFAGQVELERVPEFLRGVDVLAVPSTGAEAQPTVILEGLASGLPCVVRAAVASPDFRGLPVLSFADAAELERRLSELPSREVPLDVLRDRFGPEQALDSVLAAAGDQG